MHELSFGWRTRVRVVLAVVATFVAGVLAATPDAAWPLRIAAAAAFVVGVYGVLDALVFTASWRFTPSALKVPTLLSRRREISGRDDLAVELHDGWWSQLGVTGPNGTRRERINPLVSGTDLRRWWNATPD